MFHSLQATCYPYTLTLLLAVCPGLEFIIRGAELPTRALWRSAYTAARSVPVSRLRSTCQPKVSTASSISLYPAGLTTI